MYSTFFNVLVCVFSVGGIFNSLASGPGVGGWEAGSDPETKRPLYRCVNSTKKAANAG